MSLSDSRLSYGDCYPFLDQALADPKGARVFLDTYKQAFTFRVRLHQARKIDRKDNKEIYFDKPDAPLYGRSVYDALRMRLVRAAPEDGDDAYWLYAEHMTHDPSRVESLSEIDNGSD